MKSTINNTSVYKTLKIYGTVRNEMSFCAVRLKLLMINACSALSRTTKNNTAFSTLSSLNTQPIKHCLHWKTNGRWERGRWGEREDVVWQGQLGSLEGHSCALQLLCWTIFSTAHLIWSNGGDRERNGKEKRTPGAPPPMRHSKNRHVVKDDRSGLWPLLSW